MNEKIISLKTKLHQLIDDIDDEQTLNVLKEDAVAYLVKGNDIDEDNFTGDPVALLTSEQLQDLDESIEEVERGETITHEEFMENLKKWRTELSTQNDSIIN